MKKEFETSGLEEMFSGFRNVNEPIEEVEKVFPEVEEEKGKKKTGRPRKHKKDSYKLNVTINEEIEDYFKESQYISQMNKNEYINYLIRKDMVERVGAKKNCTDSELNQAWKEYKVKLKAFFKNPIN